MNNIVVHSFPLFDLTIDRITLDIETQKAKLSAIHFHNKKPADTFFKGLKYRKPYIDLKVPEVELEIELKGFFSSHPHIKKAIISEAVFKTIVNAELPVSPEEKPLPNRMLANSDFPITVDSIFVEDSQLNIEFIDKDPKNGLLQFNDVQATVTNLTTDPAAVEKNNIMTWDFYSTLWETGTNHIVVNYELDSENDAFIMYGRCDDMNLVDTDTLTANLYGIKVNDGILYHTYFEIEGNNDEAVGTISFDYENLKLSLDKKKKNVKGSEELKKVKKKDKLNQSFVKSMIVNGLLSKKNIPDTQKYIPAGTAYFQREKNKPIFHLMWYSISSGILEIAEARVVKDIRNFNSMFKKNNLEKGKSD